MELGKSTTKELGQEIKAAFEVSIPGRKQTFWIRKDRVVVGSVESADLKISGSSQVAPIHAVIELEFGSEISQCKAKILDLASPAGTLINGARVVQAELKSGDRVQLGDAQIKLSFLIPEVQSPLPDQALMLIQENEVVPIFDYRPSAKDTLEVVYSWSDRILNVEHFTGEGAKSGLAKSNVVLGGSEKEDFLVPPLFSAGPSHVLASVAGSSWTLNLDPKMKGLVYRGGKLSSLEEVKKESSGNSLLMQSQDFAKVEVGTLSFYVSQTVAPPVLKQNTKGVVTDPFFFKTLMLSVVGTVVALFALMNMEVQTVEEVQVPETIATILYHPEKYSVKNFPKPPVPKAKQEPVEEKIKKAEVDFTKPKEPEKKAQTKSSTPGKTQLGQNQAKEGEGARSKGQEGTRGAKNASATGKPQTAASRTSPDAGKDRGGTVSQTQDNGNVQMLKGATNKILDLLGGSGEKLGKSGSKLEGFGGFATKGSGGTALSGEGKGGGGTADTLLGGLSDKGRGGGKVGTGLGAEGTGTGIVGGKTRVELRQGGGDETVVVGAIDRDAVDAAIRARRDELLFCYEREVNAGHPNLGGKIIAAFVIGGSGRASQLAVNSSSMSNPNVERCVLNVLERIQFPQPTGGVSVSIKYPFNFSSLKK